MAIIVIRERQGGTSDTLDVDYYVFDNGNPAADVTRTTAITAALNRFLSEEGLTFTDFNDERISNHSWRINVTYSPQVLPQPDIPSTGSAQYEFNFRAQVEEIWTSEVLEVQGGVNGPDGVAATKDQFDGMMGFHALNGGAQVVQEVLRIPAGPVTDRIVYQYSPATISSSYRSTVHDLMGTVNSAPYLGWPTECLRLVEVRASVRTNLDQTISFGFAGRPQKDRTFGNFTFSNVPGWQHTWAYSRVFIDANLQPVELTATVLAVFRHRVVAVGNFNQLSLPTV